MDIITRICVTAVSLFLVVSLMDYNREEQNLVPCRSRDEVSNKTLIGLPLQELKPILLQIKTNPIIAGVLKALFDDDLFDLILLFEGKGQRMVDQEGSRPEPKLFKYLKERRDCTDCSDEEKELISQEVYRQARNHPESPQNPNRVPANLTSMDIVTRKLDVHSLHTKVIYERPTWRCTPEEVDGWRTMELALQAAEIKLWGLWKKLDTMELDGAANIKASVDIV
eukprot:TRINITY_DN1607_c0_g1_i1.p1 TRINITY_DN1607_c0_g1~~TRINITY_DN1607_c0_g1_i1.p1  ORF type:complete len:225 (-),score=17.08 TRINITY_DN1607_c0_g1_i1:83-757(-)